MITFDPLFKTLEKKHITIYSLQREGILGGGTLDKLKQNSPGITLVTIDRICNYLHCKPSNVFAYSPDRDNSAIPGNPISGV